MIIKMIMIIMTVMMIMTIMMISHDHQQVGWYWVCLDDQLIRWSGFARFYVWFG